MGLPINVFVSDIMEDIKEECNKYGRVRSIEIPRPAEGQQVAGLGKVCLGSPFIIFVFQTANVKLEQYRQMSD